MCHRMPVDALLVELLAKIVGQRSQVQFLLTGFPQGVTIDKRIWMLMLI